MVHEREDEHIFEPPLLSRDDGDDVVGTQRVRLQLLLLPLLLPVPSSPPSLSSSVLLLSRLSFFDLHHDLPSFSLLELPSGGRPPFLWCSGYDQVGQYRQSLP